MQRLGAPGTAPPVGTRTDEFEDAAFVCALCGLSPMNDVKVCNGVLRRSSACRDRHILCAACGVPSMAHSTLCPVSGCGKETHAYDVVRCALEDGVEVAGDGEEGPAGGYPLEWTMEADVVRAAVHPRGVTGEATMAQRSCLACSRPARADAPMTVCSRCRYPFHITLVPCVGPSLVVPIDTVKRAFTAVPPKPVPFLCRHCSIGKLIPAPGASFRTTRFKQAVYGSGTEARRLRLLRQPPPAAIGGAGARRTLDDVPCDACPVVGTLLTTAACHEPTCRWRGCISHVVRCKGQGCGRGVCPGCASQWSDKRTCTSCFIRDHGDDDVDDDVGGYEASEEEFDFDADEDSDEERSAAVLARLSLGKFVCDIGCGGKRARTCAACKTQVCVKCGTRCHAPGCGAWICDAHTLSCQTCGVSVLCPDCKNDKTAGHNDMLCFALPAQRLAAVGAGAKPTIKCLMCRSVTFRSADEIERCPVNPRHNAVCSDCMFTCSKCGDRMCRRCTMARLGDDATDSPLVCIRMECIGR